MLTQPQHAQNSPIPLNDVGVQVRRLPQKVDDLHDILLTGAIVFNAKYHHWIRRSDGRYDP